MQCFYLVPSGRGVGVRLTEADSGRCLLPEGHAGEHLVKGRETYYLWKPDEDCFFSEECDCECIEYYVYQKISVQKAKLILQAQGAQTPTP